MLSSIRMLLIGAVLYLAGALAWPGPVEAEPDLASTWVGETGAETAAAILVDQRSSTPLELALTGNDAAAVPDADLWAEFFTSPPSSMSARNVPASQPPVAPPPAARAAPAHPAPATPEGVRGHFGPADVPHPAERSRPALPDAVPDRLPP